MQCRGAYEWGWGERERERGRGTSDDHQIVNASLLLCTTRLHPHAFIYRKEGEGKRPEGGGGERKERFAAFLGEVLQVPTKIYLSPFIPPPSAATPTPHNHCRPRKGTRGREHRWQFTVFLPSQTHASLVRRMPSSPVLPQEPL